jgi:hypothetical protein
VKGWLREVLASSLVSETLEFDGVWRLSLLDATRRRRLRRYAA